MAKSIVFFLLLLLLLLPLLPLSPAQSKKAQGPALQALHAWLTSFNSGERTDSTVTAAQPRA